ncbi:MAG TPA: hypothetical protein DEF01_06955, partial [Gemmatimonadetes bacterium]|nr:hypothetical protein [Gemmatimonadota bacterium]
MRSPRQDLAAALRGGRVVLTGIMIASLIAIMGRALTSLYVEVLWQEQAGYLGAYWRRFFWETGVRVVGGLGVALIVHYNLKAASASLGGFQIRRRFGNIEISEQLPKHYVTCGSLLIAGLFGMWFGASLPGDLGRDVLHAVAATEWGQVDPIFS